LVSNSIDKDQQCKYHTLIHYKVMIDSIAQELV
jgi:hypothetical protein